jgi:RNA polymerase sigma-70 factor (ECF subfamily)
MYPQRRSRCDRDSSQTDREIVRLVYWDGFTLAEAAQIMARQPATVRNRIARARMNLRQHLGEH